MQGLLELYGIPYTGSSVLASALAMDKLKAKELFRLHNVPTPPYYTRRADDDARRSRGDPRLVRLPGVVKPRGEGSTLGVTKAASLVELARALDAALELDDVALVERFVAGNEVHVGILDGRVLGAIEVAPQEGHLRLRGEVHARHDRVLHAGAPPADALPRRARTSPNARRAPSAARAACASTSS